MLQCAATTTAMVRGGSRQGKYNGAQSVAGNERCYIRKKGFNFTRCQMGLPPSAQIEDSIVSLVGKTAVAVALGLSLALGGDISSFFLSFEMAIPCPV